jgi:cysteinyl-tRNA synthetase
LQAAQKGMERLLQGYQTIQKLPVSAQSSIRVDELRAKCYDAISDDLNTPILISHLFVVLKDIQAIAAGTASITQTDKDALTELYRVFLFDILGLQSQAEQQSNNSELLHTAIEMLLQVRLEAKKNKDFAKSDEIRNTLTNLGVVIKDTKDGYEWSIS